MEGVPRRAGGRNHHAALQQARHNQPVHCEMQLRCYQKIAAPKRPKTQGRTTLAAASESRGGGGDAVLRRAIRTDAAIASPLLLLPYPLAPFQSFPLPAPREVLTWSNPRRLPVFIFGLISRTVRGDRVVEFSVRPGERIRRSRRCPYSVLTRPVLQSRGSDRICYGLVQDFLIIAAGGNSSYEIV